MTRDKDGSASLVSPPGRRGRPTAKRAGEIDAAIRLAAQQLFLETGFDATRMNDIATAARVSKGTLYTRYASKETLFRAVVEDLLGKMSDRASQQNHLIPEGLEPRLRHHARILISIYGWDDYMLAIRLISDASRTFPEIEQTWEEIGTRYYIKFLAEDMAGASDLPTDHDVDWQILANIFLHTISGWYSHERMAGTISEEATEVYCDKVISAIVAIIDSARSQSD